jgi:hypothetical protein
MPHSNQLARLLVRERLQENAIDYAEDCGVRANAKRKREDRNGRERRTFAQLPQGITKILEESMHVRRPPIRNAAR